MRPHGRRPGGFFIARHTRGRTMTTATAGASAPKSSFWASGHWPTLVAAFLYFVLAFMVWVILGPLAHAISEDLNLTHAQKGLMVARSEEHTSELQSLMRNSYAVYCLKKTTI